MPPSQPNPPRLWGESALERGLSRGANQFRLTWDSVDGALRYGIRVDGGVESFEWPDATFSGFDPNTRHAFSLRVHYTTGVSPWSTPFETVTRPPTPIPPAQELGVSSLWEIALKWHVLTTFKGEDKAHINLWRQLGGFETMIASSQPLNGRWLDATDPSMNEKAYWLELIVPAASVPGNPLPGDNSSFPSAFLRANGPVVRRAVMPIVQPQSARQVWRHHYSRGSSR